MMRRRNKRGWIRILEATIAVMVIAGVLLVVYSGEVEESTARQDSIFILQKQILNQISHKDDFRALVLESSGESTELDNYAREVLGNSLNFSLRICDLTTPASACNMNSDDFISVMDREIYVEEIIISGNYATYNPKVVRLFVWYLTRLINKGSVIILL
jgi:hypothetical protein